MGGFNGICATAPRLSWELPRPRQPWLSKEVARTRDHPGCSASRPVTLGKLLIFPGSRFLYLQGGVLKECLAGVTQQGNGPHVPVALGLVTALWSPSHAQSNVLFSPGENLASYMPKHFTPCLPQCM